VKRGDLNEAQANPQTDPLTEHPPTIDEQAGHCFGCGPANPQGLQLVFILDNEAHTATAQLNLTRLHEGAPGYIHGGILATLMDEAMSKLNRPFGVLAMTRHLEVDYLRPSPVGEDLILTGRHLRRDGRKLFHEAELTMPDGTVLATGKGLFIAIDPAVVERATKRG
jgi:uncharacterized protein (TIGR00369 family)